MQCERKYKIVASDLDGTLLGKDHRVSTENMHAISEMRRRSIEFVPISGRTTGEFPIDIMESDDVKYIIISNGAVILDKKSGEAVISHYIPRDLLKFITDIEHKYTTYTLVHENGESYYDKKRHTTQILDACRINDYYRHMISTTVKSISEYDDFVLNSERIEMFCIFFEDDASLEECKRLFNANEHLSAVQTAPNNLEVYLRCAGKGNTLKAFADMLSLDMAEVIAVGDSKNDADMIKAAGLGLCVSNGHGEVKAVADKVICDVSEHSARYILESFIL